MTGPRLRFAALCRLVSELPSPRGLLPLIVGLVAWQLLQTGNSPYFPPPSAWWKGMVQIASGGKLLGASIATIETIVVGLALSIVAGATIGVVIGISPRISRALGPLLEFCRAMPPPAIVPLAILFLGYDERMKLTIVAVSAMWPILLNTSSAVQHIHPILLDVSTSFRLSLLERVRLIVIPSVIPAILLGIRIALPLTIVLTLLVEILTSIEGIGALMIAAQRNFQSGQVYGLLVLVGLFGFVLNNAFSIAQAAILQRWPPRNVQA
ncbi:ABC transporter permease [Tardiphaga sp. vice352]|jgi:ABC-type nitrate/sulfonate/bicarbonate transport system permease component|uniref:ABC transporter permease n=1 Tax=unclassified Tardiphaga TaxID=2631404 RepID=UPI0011651059|nr:MULTISPECIES: ABC transporter permease [unclassified Tardiphaga]QDM18074.1 ABC transporter permease [Tardiphaga sp. vice278]QDM23113.1 ABC transporter permease [Tardiphaga sp. vice154]QDM28283.1 ABC transporter permease [Tardiphaga sp. vice304]QDM33422.1 ABC transporter permease [Tardiphaga sp. vice352]